jgi:hypothetical protein
MPYDIGPVEAPHLGARRLLALADHIETVAPRDYNHRHWRDVLTSGQCVMCALGHGVTALPKVIGLRWRRKPKPGQLGMFGNGDIERLDGTTITVVGTDRSDNIELAAEAFELSYNEAAMIFGAITWEAARFYGLDHIHAPLTPRMVAKAIRAFALAKMAAPVS